MTQIGELSTIQYGVKGTLYIMDESTLWIENFFYTGEGPDAYFYAGTDENGKPNESGAILKHNIGQGGNKKSYQQRLKKCV